MKELGKHILFDFYDCDSKVINDVDEVRRFLLEGAKRSRATVLREMLHAFSPQGVSGVLVISESHLAIHTWPEYSFAAVDLFTCTDTIDVKILEDYLKEALFAKRVVTREVDRGSECKGN